MNVFLSKKTILPATTGLLLLTGGCVGSFDPKTDAASPLAPRIQQLVDAHREYPRWADFPAAPTDLPQPSQVAAHVGTLNTESGALATQVAGIDWTLESDPAAFVESISRRFDPARMAPIGAQTPDEVEAFAESLRRRAAAPPPIDRPRP
ncbi:MAG: hypothetical protein P0Y52_08130 [Candidatus Brevundimonas phytovorans]|nr:hypothetical protein [Brevundimonas sp.]WEK59463.1 MAG: hypothetical protein P0Y52_08130 [Brevundimonas sp.]